MISERGHSSECEPDTREVRLLIRAISSHGAAVELRLLVVERPFYVRVEVPVDADRGGSRPARSRRRVREGIGARRERVVVDLELVDTRDQLPGATPRLADLEVGARRRVPEAFVLTREQPRELKLPGLVVERVGTGAAGNCAGDVLRHHNIFAEQAEAPVVVVELRRVAQ